MRAPTPPRPAARAAALVVLSSLLIACGDRAPTGAAPQPQLAAAAASRTADERERVPAADPRPDITADMLDAYARGLDQEIALMRAHHTHFVLLSQHGDHGLQVAAKAGLPLPEYRGLRQAVHKVLYELMLHERYAGPEGQARLARVEAHKRPHADEVLARDPYASLSAAERAVVQARLGSLQPRYDSYMRLAAVGD